MTVYRVVGRLDYREHAPGTVFEADIPLDAETRAVTNGHLEVVKRERVEIQPGSWTLPDGWRTSKSNQEAPQGASLMREVNRG